jgi:hypothetical protein
MTRGVPHFFSSVAISEDFETPHFFFGKYFFSTDATTT